MRQYAEGDPIRVQTDADGRPVLITWHGQTDQVATIEDVREPRLDWWAATGEVHRVYYLVTTERGVIGEIYRDVLDGDRVGGEWYVARVLD